MTSNLKTPLQKRAKKTRNTIIEAAFRLFFKNGYKKTSTNLIAKEAKVSIGILYSYFNNKNELFELWLNTLLEKSDEYFYKQFKLRDYDIDFPLIISNILDKTSESFFQSAIAKEKGDEYFSITLNSFYKKAKQIFIKSCYDNDIIIDNPTEVSHLIFKLMVSYNEDLKVLNSEENFSLLKSKYIQLIINLLNVN